MMNQPSQPGAGAAATATLSPADLAELIGAFNEVTVRLESTHESLRSEVSRLQDELAQANRQLERAQRLAALGEMAAGIAHEIRNPLGAIRLHARILEQDLADRPQEQTISRKVLGAVDRMEAVVSDVLAFSKEFKVRVCECDASDLLDRVVEECAAAEPGRVNSARPLEFVRKDIARGVPVGVECDPMLMHRALANVVRNAVQAVTPEDHEKWSTTRNPSAPRRVELDVRVERIAGPTGTREMVVFVVADTGPGIGADVLQRMFNPFFTTRAAGTGLGLAIVHRIIDAHGGVVRAGNRPVGDGTGAVFELLTPAKAPVQQESRVTSRGTEPTLVVCGTSHPDHEPLTAASAAGLMEQA